MVQTFKFEEFCDLDTSNYADYLIRSMDVMLSLIEIQNIKQESVNFLELSAGDKVLEIGCGTANDAALMAQLVGETGEVIAIDSSKRMLEEAKSRFDLPNICYLQMRAECIEYPDNYFSAVHADRLLVSHANYNDIFHEMLRVTKPGGIISITDVDAETITITPDSEVTALVLKQILLSFVNCKIGRKLPTLFAEHNLLLTHIQPNFSKVQDFEILKQIFDFDRILASCVEQGLCSQQTAMDWLQQMETHSLNKQFFYCITFFTVSGRKPFPLS